MATTTNGWPYDQSSDTPFSYPARTQTLADTLESRLGKGGLRYLAEVSPSAASSVNMNTVFSSTYSHYLCEYTLTHSVSTVGLQVRMRLVTTDDTTTNYHDFTSSGPTTQTGQTSMRLAFLALSGSWGTFDIWHPATAVATRFTGLNGIVPTSPSCNYFSAAHNVATAYDGMTLFPSSGTMTGVIRVYGYLK